MNAPQLKVIRTSDLGNRIARDKFGGRWMEFEGQLPRSCTRCRQTMSDWWQKMHARLCDQCVTMRD